MDAEQLRRLVAMDDTGLSEVERLRRRVEELEAEAAGVDAGIGSMAIVNDNLKARVSELAVRNKRMQESLAAGRELQHFTAEGTRLATLDRAAEVAEQYAGVADADLAETIAAAIRALKEQAHG